MTEPARTVPLGLAIRAAIKEHRRSQPLRMHDLISNQLGSHGRRGFTLLELLVVMVIIGLLASYVGPRYFDQIGKSEVKAARAQLDAFDKALATYRLDNGHYPRTDQGLKALTERPSDEPKWSGPYLSKALPTDPWGKPYIYKNPGDDGHEFDVVTLGRDGQTGGTGLDADISVWTGGR